MRLKKTVAVALATAMLASVAAVPAFAESNKITVKANDTGYDQYLDGATEANNTANSFNTASNTSKGTTEVVYKVTETYTWSIPKTIDFGADAGVNKSVIVLSEDKTAQNSNESDKIYRTKNDDSVVKVTKNVIPENMTLTIKVSGENYDKTGSTYRVKAENSSTYLNYTIKKSEETSAQALTNNGTVLEVTSGIDEGSQALVFTLTTNSTTDGSKIAEVAGSYKDTLTFTATVENQAQSGN